jgi:predicted trehalose synthase
VSGRDEPPTLRARVAEAVASLDPAAVAARRWSGVREGTLGRLRLVEAFDLRASAADETSAGGDAAGAPDDGSGTRDAAGGIDGPAPAPGGNTPLFAVAEAPIEGGSTARFSLVLVGGPDGTIREAGEGDGPWRALATAAAAGRVIPALHATEPGTGGHPGRVTAALVCRPAMAMAALAPAGEGSVAERIARSVERPLGADQSNSSAVVGERLLVKLFRRLQPGLNPDLEMNAYLAEEAEFGAVPRLAGYVELVTPNGVETVALVSEHVADATDAFEDLAERLVAWLLAPGEVTVEFATAVVDELGRLTAGLHATLAAARIPGFEPRPATRDELREWHRAADRQLEASLAALSDADRAELRAAAPAIAAAFTVYEAMAAPPFLTRIHADLHLGQLLASPDGFLIIDFEGEPARPIAERAGLASPLRDVASMLRSLDHVAGSAERWAVARNGGPLDHAGLDVDGWRRRARERFLAAYRAGLREGGATIEVDEDLLRAFEIEKETYEFGYAATYLPSWMWAPREGMARLLAEGGDAAGADPRVAAAADPGPGPGTDR